MLLLALVAAPVVPIAVPALVLSAAAADAVALVYTALLAARGYTFPSISMAYMMFEMPHVIRIADDAKVPIRCIKNGMQRDMGAFPRRRG
jgi:hypothetical protein